MIPGDFRINLPPPRYPGKEWHEPNFQTYGTVAFEFEQMVYEGAEEIPMTCEKCGGDMAFIPPRDPPTWIELWRCECGHSHAVLLGKVEKVLLTVSVVT